MNTNMSASQKDPQWSRLDQEACRIKNFTNVNCCSLESLLNASSNFYFGRDTAHKKLSLTKHSTEARFANNPETSMVGVTIWEDQKFSWQWIHVSTTSSRISFGSWMITQHFPNAKESSSIFADLQSSLIEYGRARFAHLHRHSPYLWLAHKSHTNSLPQTTPFQKKTKF